MSQHIIDSDLRERQSWAVDIDQRQQKQLINGLDSALSEPLLNIVALPDVSHLRIALFSGNYNYTKDGANQALNKLVAYLESRGAAVRVYSPTSETPAFKHAGTLVSVPSFVIPGRSDYRFSLGIDAKVRKDLDTFSPNIIHVSAPDFLGKAAAKYAKRNGISLVASVHTRFENYLKYYKLGWLENSLKKSINRFYNRCDRVLAPNGCMLDILQDEGVTSPIGVWARGVDQNLFSPEKRDLQWRRNLGIHDDESLILFVGRLVREKGLESFAQSIDALNRLGTKHRVLIVGDGPERSKFQERLANKAVFTGFLVGEDLARAYASADILLNPSTTEAFGNVMLEAMASGLPAACAQASGSNSLIKHEVNGLLVEPDNAIAFAEALTKIIQDVPLRQKMRISSWKLAKAFTWSTILESVIEQYQMLYGADR